MENNNALTLAQNIQCERERETERKEEERQTDIQEKEDQEIGCL